MPKGLFFLQECPTCGRRVEVRVEYLGRTVACQHCRGQFVALDRSRSTDAACRSSLDLLDRVDELLASVANDSKVRTAH